MYVSQSLATSYSLSRESIEFAENSASPEVDFEPKSGKTSFLEFSRKEAVFGKNWAKLKFWTCADSGSIFMESHSWLINPLLTLEYDVAAKFLLSP